MMSLIKIIKQHYKLLVLASILDVLFFYTYGMLTGPIKETITQTTTQTFIDATTQNIGIITALTSTLKYQTIGILSYIIATIVIGYILYVLFHGTNWWIANKMTGKTTKYGDYLMQFAKINLVWLAGYVMYKIITLITQIKHVQQGPDWITRTITILFGLVIIAAQYSYVNNKTLQIFKMSMPKLIKTTITALALFFIPFLTINYLNLSFTTTLTLSMLTIFPIMTIIRIYLIQKCGHTT